jgi:quercetin dioxygenase-like cupin family protein
MSSLTDISIPVQVSVDWFADEAGGVATAAFGPDRQATMVERTAPSGYMAPLHRRDQDESYRVAAGELTFYVDGDVINARAGDVVVAPAGATRTWRAESDDARWIVLTRVAQLQRYVDFGRSISPPLPDSESGDWPSPEELQALQTMAGANGIELLGPPGTLPKQPTR